MLNNKNMPEMSYETRTIIFDTSCKGCPYAEYRAVNTAPYTGNKKISVCSSLKEATEHLTLSGRIERYCNFNEANLVEITNNTCMFWYHSEHDEGEFVEIEVAEFNLFNLKVHLEYEQK